MENTTQHDSHQRFLGQLPPKTAFIFGIVSAVAVMSLLGLLVLLGSGVGKGTTSSGSAAKTKGSGQAAAAAPSPSAAPTGSATVTNFRKVNPQRDHIRGNPKAKVSVIEYSDFECPFCKRHHPTMQQIVETYGDKVNWVYRHFPLESLHSQAKKEAEASECAGEQGKFWEFTDTIFEVTPSNNGLDLTKLAEYAKESGVKDLAKFNDCVDKEKYKSVVEEDLADATAAGGNGTPYNLIVDAQGKATPISGALPFAQFKTVIDQALR